MTSVDRAFIKAFSEVEPRLSEVELRLPAVAEQPALVRPARSRVSPERRDSEQARGLVRRLPGGGMHRGDRGNVQDAAFRGL